MCQYHLSFPNGITQSKLFHLASFPLHIPLVCHSSIDLGTMLHRYEDTPLVRLLVILELRYLCRFPTCRYRCLHRCGSICPLHEPGCSSNSLHRHFHPSKPASLYQIEDRTSTDHHKWPHSPVDRAPYTRSPCPRTEDCCIWTPHEPWKPTGPTLTTWTRTTQSVEEAQQSSREGCGTRLWNASTI